MRAVLVVFVLLAGCAIHIERQVDDGHLCRVLSCRGQH